MGLCENQRLAQKNKVKDDVSEVENENLFHHASSRAFSIVLKLHCLKQRDVMIEKYMIEFDHLKKI